MATIYIKLYDILNNDLYLPLELLDFHCEIDYLKNLGPDDGEAVSYEGKYSITCPDVEWRSVLEALKESGTSLVYSVVLKGRQGESILQESLLAELTNFQPQFWLMGIQGEFAQTHPLEQV